MRERERTGPIERKSRSDLAAPMDQTSNDPSQDDGSKDVSAAKPSSSGSDYQRDEQSNPTPEAEMGWIALFSGGKDSSLALYRALERGLDVRRLLTVHPVDDSYMYHVPETQLASMAANSIGIESIDVEPSTFGADEATDSATQGDEELAVLENAIEDTMERVDWGLAGIIAGAIESEFQTSRIEAMCDRLDCDLFSPLWRSNERDIAEELIDNGFEVIIVQVAAKGLDDSWLGRTLDSAAFDELERLNRKHGVHLLGEGGEFETFVLDGPHMDRRIDIEYDIEWNGTRGRIHVRSASLE